MSELRTLRFRASSTRFVLLVAIVSGTLLAACQSAPAPPVPAISPDTWAVVDGDEITRDEVERSFRRTGNPSAPLAEEEALAAKLTLLNDLILQRILLARANRLKIVVPESDIDTAYNNAKANTTDEAFNKELASRNLSAADLREGLRRDLVAQEVLEQEVTSKIVVAEEEITALFEQNREQFNLAEESYHLAQIAITPVADPQLSNTTGDDATTPEAAEAKLKMLVERLKSGTPFQELAASYSEDPASAPRGGDLGLVPVSQLRQAPAALRNAVINQPPGSVNVATFGGAHTIVFVVAREAAGQRDLSTPGVRDQVKEAVRTRKEQLLRAAYVTAARTDADVVNYLARRLVESHGKNPDGQAPSPAPASSQAPSAGQ